MSVELHDPMEGGEAEPFEDYNPEDLDELERGRLLECEAVIERGLETFHAVGRSLLTIRDTRLYRQTHATFEDYCRQRWGIDRTYAHRLIQSVKVVETLPIGNTPICEAQARELVPLLSAGQPDEIRRVWSEANERTAGRPTAAAIREVREERAKPRELDIALSYEDALYKAEKALESLERWTKDRRFARNRPRIQERCLYRVRNVAVMAENVLVNLDDLIAVISAPNVVDRAKQARQ